MNWRDVPIPKRMVELERDVRGFPIPVGVLRDNDGNPHFTINDEEKRQELLKSGGCPICGHTITPGYHWFVGGPLSAFHANGAYIDLSAHRECIEYALRVCPYLISAKYHKRIDGKTLDNTKYEGTVLIDPTMLAERPKVFVAVRSNGRISTNTPGGYVRPIRPYRDVVYWKDGNILSKDEGRKIIIQETTLGYAAILQWGG